MPSGPPAAAAAAATDQSQPAEGPRQVEVVDLTNVAEGDPSSLLYDFNRAGFTPADDAEDALLHEDVSRLPACVTWNWTRRLVIVLVLYRLQLSILRYSARHRLILSSTLECHVHDSRISCLCFSFLHRTSGFNVQLSAAAVMGKQLRLQYQVCSDRDCSNKVANACATGV